MCDHHVLVPTKQPCVSEIMEEIKNVIEKIIQNGYASDGNVYFSSEKFPAYCLLSGRKPEDNLAGDSERVLDSLTLNK